MGPTKVCSAMVRRPAQVLRQFVGRRGIGRFILNKQSMWMREMAQMLKPYYPKLKIRTWQLPNLVMYLAPLFEKGLSFGFLKRNLGRMDRVTGSRRPTTTPPTGSWRASRCTSSCSPRTSCFAGAQRACGRPAGNGGREQSSLIYAYTRLQSSWSARPSRRQPLVRQDDWNAYS